MTKTVGDDLLREHAHRRACAEDLLRSHARALDVALDRCRDLERELAHARAAIRVLHPVHAEPAAWLSRGRRLSDGIPGPLLDAHDDAIGSLQQRELVVALRAAGIEVDP